MKKTSDHDFIVRACNDAHILACMHPIVLHLQAGMMAKVSQIREIKVSMDEGEHATHL